MPRVASFFQRWIAVFFTFLILSAIAGGIYLDRTGLRFDYNIESFFPDDDPAILAYRDFSDRYSPDDGIVLIGFETDSVFSSSTLTDIDRISRQIDGLRSVERVVSLTSYEQLSSQDGEIKVERVIRYFGPDPDSLLSQKNRVLSDSVASGFLVNDTGNVVALYVYMDRDERGYSARQVLIESIIEIIEPFEGEYEFRISGIPYLRNRYVDVVQSEAIRYVGYSSIVIIICLLWLFGNLRAIVIPLITVYLGVLATGVAIMATGSTIDVLTSTISAIILVVGVADSIHLMTRFNDGIGRGLKKDAAVRDMIERLGSATFLTSVTTAIGFATLATSNIVPVRKFGIYTAAGVLFTFVISIILLTAALSWMPARSSGKMRASGNFEQLMRHFSVLVSRKAGPILIGSVAVLLLSILGASRLRVNAFVNDDLGPRNEIYQDMVFFQEKLVSPFPLEILLTSDSADAFHDPELLRGVRNIQHFLDAQPEVGRTVSVVDLLEEMNASLNPEVGSDRLPVSRDLVAQYLFLLELAGPADQTKLVNAERSEVRISALVDDMGSIRLNPFLARLDSVISHELPTGEVSSMTTGTIVLASTVSAHIVDSLLVSIGLAFLFISALMAFLYKKVELVIISLVPNVLPLVATAGLMGFMGIEIKPATAVIFSIVFGIAVDDTIHFLARLRQELARGQTLQDSVHTALLGTGKAILLTSIILVGGFVVLTTSTFQSTTYMGGLVSITVVLALLADLLLLPALLLQWDRIRPGFLTSKSVTRRA